MEDVSHKENAEMLENEHNDSSNAVPETNHTACDNSKDLGEKLDSLDLNKAEEQPVQSTNETEEAAGPKVSQLFLLPSLWVMSSAGDTMYRVV